ncbi:MAG: bleomycin resistance family protein, partial [Cyanobacteria bacterium P01_E01_bin.34]
MVVKLLGGAMFAKAITPILNVSDLQQSFEWFKILGWQKCWDWGEPPTFGSVGSGECEIYLCQDGQGGRGKGQNRTTFGEGSGEDADRGVWLSIWVEDVDSVYRHCVEQNI